MQHILLILIICNIVSANIFSTALGDCNLEIYEGKVKNNPEIVSIIKNETNNLILHLGPIHNRPFSIYITNNIDVFLDKSQGPIPEWGVAVAKLNPDRIILHSSKISNMSFNRLKEIIIHLNLLKILKVKKLVYPRSIELMVCR